MWAQMNRARHDAAVADKYRRRFVQEPVETRYRRSVRACAKMQFASEGELGKCFDHAMELCRPWFRAEEMDEVNRLLREEKKEVRERIEAQLAICKDWFRWETAKPLLYVKYVEPDAETAGTMEQIVDDKRVVLCIRSSEAGYLKCRIYMLVWFAWYWGISEERVWRAAYDGRFDAFDQPLREEYVENEVDPEDVSGEYLRQAIEEKYGSRTMTDDELFGIGENRERFDSSAAYRMAPVDELAPPPQKKKEGCYIATAVYGSYDAPEVRVLRRFRDERLKKTAAGRWFIRTYYRLSPPLAEKLRNAGRINRLVRRALDCWVRRLERKC